MSKFQCPKMMFVHEHFFIFCVLRVLEVIISCSGSEPEMIVISQLLFLNLSLPNLSVRLTATK